MPKLPQQPKPGALIDKNWFPDLWKYLKSIPDIVNAEAVKALENNTPDNGGYDGPFKVSPYTPANTVKIGWDRAEDEYEFIDLITIKTIGDVKFILKDASETVSGFTEDSIIYYELSENDDSSGIVWEASPNHTPADEWPPTDYDIDKYYIPLAIALYTSGDYNACYQLQHGCISIEANSFSADFVGVSFDDSGTDKIKILSGQVIIGEDTSVVGPETYALGTDAWIYVECELTMDATGLSYGTPSIATYETSQDWYESANDSTGSTLTRRILIGEIASNAWIQNHVGAAYLESPTDWHTEPSYWAEIVSVSSGSTYNIKMFDSSGSTTTAGEINGNESVVAGTKILVSFSFSGSRYFEYTDTDTDTDEKVKADSGDSTAGYLDEKVQNSLVLDPVTHKIELENDEAVPSDGKFYGKSGGVKGWFVGGTSSTDELVASKSGATANYLDVVVADGDTNTYSSTQTLQVKGDNTSANELQLYIKNYDNLSPRMIPLTTDYLLLMDDATKSQWKVTLSTLRDTIISGENGVDVTAGVASLDIDSLTTETLTVAELDKIAIATAAGTKWISPLNFLKGLMAFAENYDIAKDQLLSNATGTPTMLDMIVQTEAMKEIDGHGNSKTMKTTAAGEPGWETV